MQQPTLNPTPFAQNGQKNTIPDTASGGTASFSQGFPALTMTPISQGGIPPSGQDFNGILNHLDSHVVWQSAGMGYIYDNNFTNAIGGYAVGAVLRSKDGLTAYVNTVAGNKTDPESGQGWNVYAGAGLKIEPIKVGGILIHTTYNTPEEVRAGEGYGVWTRFADGRVIMGSGTGTDSNGTSMAFTNGQTGGEYSHKLTVDEMPSHSHDFHLSTHITGNGYPATDNQDNSPGGMKTDSTGGDKFHNNVQPFIAVGMWLRMADSYVASIAPATSPVTIPAVTAPTSTTPTATPVTQTTSHVTLNYSLPWGQSLTLSNLGQNVPDWQTGQPKLTKINDTPILRQAGQTMEIEIGGIRPALTLAWGVDPEVTITITAIENIKANLSVPTIINFTLEDAQNIVTVTCVLTLFNV